MIGIGYDVHGFVEGRRLILGGVEIPYGRGLAGHSDADVLCHAIADAVLGAMGKADIGFYFPPGEEVCRGISSLKILEKCREILEEEGLELVNVDATVIAEAPRVLPFREEMQRKIGEALGLDARRVGIKATTNEAMGFIGRGEGIAAMAVAQVRD